ncbi:MAG: hypothetical protein JXA95_17085 [Spirochaetales bacterium]|nr:hypothetical protein [Spirochaetales bacterium]
MKRFFTIIFLSLIYFCINADGGNLLSIDYVDSFFKGEYTVIDEKFAVNEHRYFTMCVHFIDEELGVFDKALLYEDIDGGIYIHLTLEDKTFTNSSGFKIENFKGVKNLRGFSSKFNYPPDPTYAPGLVFDGHFGDDLYTSDSFYIDWDYSQQAFVRYVLNYDEL